jgi:hypothetical protein
MHHTWGRQGIFLEIQSGSLKERDKLGDLRIRGWEGNTYVGLRVCELGEAYVDTVRILQVTQK